MYITMSTIMSCQSYNSTAVLGMLIYTKEVICNNALQSHQIQYNKNCRMMTLMYQMQYCTDTTTCLNAM